jgi:hypothetical protein
VIFEQVIFEQVIFEQVIFEQAPIIPSHSDICLLMND